MALSLEAAGARLHYAPYFDGVADGLLRLEGPLGRLSVSGSLTLGQGDLFVLPVQAPRRSTDAAFDPVLDLEVAAGEELWVNLGELRLQVQGTVKAMGTWSLPRLAGGVRSERGTFNAFNTTFILNEGQPTFAEFRGTSPYVDARVETTIQVAPRTPTRVGMPPGTESRLETVHVFLHIFGTPDDLVVEVTSDADPALTREEIPWTETVSDGGGGSIGCKASRLNSTSAATKGN